MKARYLVTILLATASLGSQAFSGDDDRGGGTRGTAAGPFAGVRAAMFAEFKAIESWSHRERIRILQEAENCIQAAADREQYRACERNEQASRERVKEQVRARHEALRARAEDLRRGLLSRN